jgi:predicted SprT family Zn-dependent metalloprotease
MNRIETMNEGRVIVALALAEFGLPENSLPMSWNGRLTSTRGRCRNTIDPITGERRSALEFSVKVMAASTPQGREQCFAHEAAHGIVWLLHGPIYRGRRRDSHGPAWQQTMRRLGYQPDRCHTVNLEGIDRRTAKLSCGRCGTGLGRYTPRKAASVRASRSLRLRCCGVQPGSVIREERIRRRIL